MEKSMQKTFAMRRHETARRFDKRSAFVAAVTDMQSQNSFADARMPPGGDAECLRETPAELRLHHSSVNPYRPTIRG